MRFDAVLLDMDGTVLDTLEDLADATNAALRAFSLPERSVEEVRGIVGNGAERLIALATPEGTPESLRAEALAWFRVYYDAHCRVKTRPYDGILPLLEKLRAAGLRLAVISNKPDSAVKILAEEHFPGLLDLALGEKPPLRRKPWPDMIEAGCADLHLPVGRCLYVGDSEVDVLTAKNAGIACASVCWGFRSREELLDAGATALFDTPEELGSWILKTED